MATETKYSYYVEDKAHAVTDRPRKFLEAFAAVLDHSNYGLALETYARLSTKCARCTSACTRSNRRRPIRSRIRELRAVVRAFINQALGSSGAVAMNTGEGPPFCHRVRTPGRPARRSVSTFLREGRTQ